MSNIEDLAQQFEQQQMYEKKINETPFFDILEKNLSKKVLNIIHNKFGYRQIRLSKEENLILLDARNALQDSLKCNTVMCKVLPIKYIRSYLSTNYEFSNCMLRKGDLKYLIDNNFDKNIVTTLYNSLRLDYSGSEFKKCKKMVILEVKLSSFANRIPLNSKYFDKRKDTILHNNPFPYLGNGYTSNIHGIPEFYVTISNEISSYVTASGAILKVGYGKFPIMAFDVDLFVADREANEIVKIASYNCDTIEGQNIYDKFSKYNSTNNFELRNKIIFDYHLEDLLF